MSILSIATLTQLVNSVTADGDVHYVPYDIRDTNIFYGIPPIPIRGLNRVSVDYIAPRAAHFSCLTGKGCHAGNKNTAGIIELELMAGSVSGGATQVLSFLEQPMPFFIEDGQSGGTSLIIAPECRLLQTSPWKREATPGTDTYVFSSVRMSIIHGMRLVNN